MAQINPFHENANPAAETVVDLYTVPASTTTVVSTVNITNAGTTEARVRLIHLPSGESLGTEHYLAYDVPLPAGGSGASLIEFTSGYTLSAGDKIQVRATSADVAFNIYGEETA